MSFLSVGTNLDKRNSQKSKLYRREQIFHFQTQFKLNISLKLTSIEVRVKKVDPNLLLKNNARKKRCENRYNQPAASHSNRTQKLFCVQNMYRCRFVVYKERKKKIV